MIALDQRIDALYQLPLGDFTTARNALAKTLTGGAAQSVRALKKPAVVPWAVNQVFWQARPLHDRLFAQGRALRAAMLAALTGQKADVQAATEAHRQTVAAAVHRATHLAAAAGLHPAAERLGRLFEALSLAADHPAAPGRLTDIVQPLGFETLAGVTIAENVTPFHPPTAHVDTRSDHAALARPSAAKRPGHRPRAHADRQRAAALAKKAARNLERARMAESAARRNVDRAEAALRRAAKTVADARERLSRIAGNETDDTTGP
jgi:hypothetical protein